MKKSMVQLNRFKFGSSPRGVSKPDTRKIWSLFLTYISSETNCAAVTQFLLSKGSLTYLCTFLSLKRSHMFGKTPQMIVIELVISLLIIISKFTLYNRSWVYRSATKRPLGRVAVADKNKPILGSCCWERSISINHCCSFDNLRISWWSAALLYLDGGRISLLSSNFYTGASSADKSKSPK
jgi:hypothetical protein